MVYDCRRHSFGITCYSRTLDCFRVSGRKRMQLIETPNRRLWRAPAGLDPLVPEFIIYKWEIQGCPRIKGAQQYSLNEQALLWFVSGWLRLRAGYRFVLPESVSNWLNAVELDLTDKIRHRPNINGSVRTEAPKPVSRFMYSIAEQHNRLSDLTSGEGYYKFLVWYAFYFMPAWNIPGSLLPAAIIDLLNAPAGDEDFPLTIGMWLYLKAAYPAEAAIATRGEVHMLARSFHLLENILHKGDVRLIPPAVSRFWSQRPLDTQIVTSFEYVLAQTRNTAAVQSADEQGLRDWYHREVISARPDGIHHLFSGTPSFGTCDQRQVKRTILDKAVLIYRDHDSIAGLSQAGMSARDALAHSDVPTFDLHFSLPRARLPEEAKRNSALLVNARRQLHLMNINPEYIPECYYCNYVRMQPADYVIGQLYWELSSISTRHEPGIALLDEIWTASEYLKAIYSAHTTRPVITMGQAVVPPSHVPPAHRGEFGIKESSYVFLSSFDAQSVIERKNPLGVIKAFQAAFPRKTEDVALLIKTRNLEPFVTEGDCKHWTQAAALVAKDPRIQVITHTLSHESMAVLYRMCDCFVSLHRSEGFGFGPAEAMSHGKPVIVTDYSGVREFCTEATAKLVGFELIRVKPDQYPYADADREYFWAEPDLMAAAERMRELAEDRTIGERLGCAGRELISRKFSIAALQSRYMARLRQLGFA
jgi:glycosyltransferase involved in cell wall biosynthesis